LSEPVVTKKLRWTTRMAIDTSSSSRIVLGVSSIWRHDIYAPRLMWRNIRLDHLSLCPSVGLSVCLAAKCIVAKRLSGSACRLGWWVWSVKGWVY